MVNMSLQKGTTVQRPPSTKVRMNVYIWVRPDLTSPTCDTHRGSDFLTLLGPIHPWFSLTLVSCSRGKHKMAKEKRKQLKKSREKKEIK